MVRFTVCALLCLAAAGVEVPYGHPDFYPGPDRTLGWRGDGTGSWPGAAIVASWDAVDGRNVVWKSRMPGAGFAQPIVVGEKVFSTADPNLLVCADVHDGEILWQVAVDHTLAMEPGMAEQVRAEQEFARAKWFAYVEWLEAGQALARRVDEAGFDGGAVWWDIKKGHVIHEALNDEEQRASQAEFLADPEIAAEFARLKEIGLANGFVRQKGCNGAKILTGGQLPDPLRKGEAKAFAAELDQSVGKRIKRNRIRYDLWMFDNWEGYTTWSFATPCTDGEYVYVTTVNNAVAAVDLAGEISWLVWDHPEDGNDGNVLHTRYVPSPLLAGDRLVVNQNGEVRAFDKATGEKLWSVVNPYGKGKKRPCRPAPEACSPAWARLPLGDGHLDVVVDAGGNIYRLEDGAIVGTGLPRMGKGASPICVDDLYVWKTGADNRPSKVGVVRMVAKSRDEVVPEELWEKGSADKGSLTNVLHAGAIFYSPDKKRGSLAFDLRSGEEREIGPRIGGSSCSPIVAGDKLVQLSCGSFGGEERGIMGGVVLDLATREVHRVGRGFHDLSIYGDDEFARRNRHVGCGHQISNASPSAQANRLFFRTKGYLWCIGDPSQPFPVPADCPPRARVR